VNRVDEKYFHETLGNRQNEPFRRFFKEADGP